MSYLFPKRVLRAGDVLDPSELTEDISPAADRLGGRLNAHNISDSISTSVAVDPEAFYKYEHYYEGSRFVWTNSVAGNHIYPDEGGNTYTDAALVQNNFEWQAIIDQNDVAMRRTISTGTSVLWVNAFVQYLWHGFDQYAFGSIWWTPLPTTNNPGQHRNGAMTIPCGLQFAIRVDGAVIAETITGIDDAVYRSSIPIKPNRQRSDTVLIAPGPADARGEQICSLGPPCLPIRVGACVPVTPGDHVVELVVRRVPFVRSKARGDTVGGIIQYGPYDKIYLYSRQLNVIELKAHPVDSVAAFESSAPSFSEEELLSQSSLYTTRVQSVINDYNAVGEGALQRGALINDHLPSALLGAATTEREYGTGPTFNNWIPDLETMDTVTTTAYAGAPGTGWTLIANSGVDPIRIDNFSVSTACKVLVLANLQVRNIKGSGVANPATGQETIDQRASSIADFALFKIMWQLTTDSATTWTGVDESIGMVNNFVWWPKTPTQTDYDTDQVAAVEGAPEYGLEHVEVQLMALLDFDPPSATPINIGVFGGVATDGCTYEVGRGNIIALALRTP